MFFVLGREHSKRVAFALVTSMVLNREEGEGTLTSAKALSVSGPIFPFVVL